LALSALLLLDLLYLLAFSAFPILVQLFLWHPLVTLVAKSIVMSHMPPLFYFFGVSVGDGGLFLFRLVGE
jgi:hypothetical protein